MYKYTPTPDTHTAHALTPSAFFQKPHLPGHLHGDGALTQTKHLPTLHAPSTPLAPTYPEDTDKGIKLGFQGGSLLWQGQTVVPAG